MPFSRRNTLLPVLLCSVVLIAASCTGSSNASRSAEPAGVIPVRHLGSILELRQQFNEDAGDIRLILLISPT